METSVSSCFRFKIHHLFGIVDNYSALAGSYALRLRKKIPVIFRSLFGLFV